MPFFVSFCYGILSACPKVSFCRYRQYFSYFIKLNPLTFCRYHGIMILPWRYVMQYLSVAETAKKWNLSERTVRNYCAAGRIPNAFLTGKTWNIPEDAAKPERKNKNNKEPQTLLAFLRMEKAGAMKGGIYHRIQVDLTYNSNHMEGSRRQRNRSSGKCVGTNEQTAGKICCHTT